MTLKRTIARITWFIIFTVIVAAFLYILFNYESRRLKLGEEIQLFGPIGLVFAGLFVDTLGGPLGPEMPTIAGLLTGIPWTTVALMVALGSLIGSLVIYVIGHYFGEYGALLFINRKTFERWRIRFFKYRRLTMTLAALTPVPYVTCCVIAGVFNMKLWEFLAFAFGARVLRILGTIYLYFLLSGVI
ncbi:MAG: VTT domain-containing protein [Patescibacteria group bacterium]